MKHDHSNIKKAKKYLDNNNCIGIPTETKTKKQSFNCSLL